MCNEEKLKPVDINKFEETCLKIGVNIKNDDGTYRCFIDVLQDMSKKFNEGIKSNED